MCLYSITKFEESITYNIPPVLLEPVSPPHQTKQETKSETYNSQSIHVIKTISTTISVTFKKYMLCRPHTQYACYDVSLYYL